MMKPYIRFAGMVITATIIMYLFKYLNTYQFDHIFFSETRLYMALLMGSSMTFIMLLFMRNMLKNRTVNIGIFAGSVLVFGLSLFLVRSQDTVEDVSYMRSMIPHHSIAILTSKRAEIDDPRVRELADEIIQAQKKEIAEMKKLIDELEDE